jgi:hypothetical protein
MQLLGSKICNGARTNMKKLIVLLIILSFSIESIGIDYTLYAKRLPAGQAGSTLSEDTLRPMAESYISRKRIIKSLLEIGEECPAITPEEEAELAKRGKTELEKIDEGIISAVYKAGQKTYKVYKRHGVKQLKYYQELTAAVKNILEHRSEEDEVLVDKQPYKVVYRVNPVNNILQTSEGKVFTESAFVGSESIVDMPDIIKAIQILLAKKEQHLKSILGEPGICLFFPGGTQVSIDNKQKHITLTLTDVSIHLTLLEMSCNTLKASSAGDGIGSKNLDNTTGIMRFAPTYDYIRRIIPEIIKRKQSQGLPVRIEVWSLGCSIGYEPISLAVVIHDEISKHPEWGLEFGKDILISVKAVDINPSNLISARAVLKSGVPDSLANSHFINSNLSAVRNYIQFIEGDITDNAIMEEYGKADIVVASEVIYQLHPDAREKMFNFLRGMRQHTHFIFVVFNYLRSRNGRITVDEFVENLEKNFAVVALDYYLFILRQPDTAKPFLTKIAKVKIISESIASAA